MKYLITLLAAFLISAQAHAEIISAQEMKTLMDSDEALVIIDAGNAESYAAGHLEGAVNLGLASLHRRGDVPGLIKCLGELSDVFGQHGIRRDSNIVVYDDGRQLYASRVYWILKHVGATNAKILHRDTDTWNTAGLSLVTTTTDVEPVEFIPNPAPELFASTDYVKDMMDDANIVIVDVRTPAEYTGAAPSSDGHIDGAVNINFTDMLTDTGAFKSASELEAIADANGITPDKELILYCKTSVRATVSFTAFTEVLGYENVKVYDGAYAEWSTSNPVVR